MKKEEIDSQRLEVLITHLIELIVSELGSNPYDELEKARKIVAARNFDQFPSIEKEMKKCFLSDL